MIYDRPLYYLLDEKGVPYPTDDRHTANDLLINWLKRRVGLDEKEVAGHSIRISTVFLVMDHNHFFEGPPVLYETMLFIDDKAIDGATERYETREQAIAGHAETLEKTEQVLMLLQQQNIDVTQIVGLLKGEVSEP